MAMSDAGSSGTRDPMVFVNEVRRQFSPVLAEAGFTEVRAEITPIGLAHLTLVEFEGRGVFVEIMQESYSAEISVEMGLTALPEHTVGLNEWIQALGGEPDSGWYGASTVDRVRSGVGAVAEAFEDYAASRIQSRDDFLLAMDQVWAWQRAEQRLSETTQIRREAETAWRAKDLDTVIRLYRQLRPEDLNVVDRKRLALAERLAQDGGGEGR